MTPFHDLDAFQALPRVSGLALSPDGTRLVTSVATLDPDAVRWVTALWEVDPAGERPAARLTRSRKGEAAPTFLPDGSLLFTSARPDPDEKETPDDAPASLWLLPARGGEARVVGTRPGGVGGVVVARDAGTVVVTSKTLPGATDGADDERRRKERKDKKVSAILHTGYPVRYWDADLGPDAPRLLAGDINADIGADTRVDWRDLTPSPGRALDQASYDVSPDGRTVVASWFVAEAGAARRATLVALEDGGQRTLLEEGDHEYGGPRISPDGRLVAVTRASRSTPQEPEDPRLVVAPLDGAAPPRDVAPGWDRWALDRRWTPDGSALIVTADEGGCVPVFRIDLATGEVVRLTGDAGAYTDLQVSPDGRHVYALRSAIDAAPSPVRLDAAQASQQPTYLPGPVDELALPGTLTELTTAAADGTPLHSWLALPDGDGPHPLVLWVHGGPLSSWSAWSWRWNPWLLASRGYAVLMPDPGLSTGYGIDMVRRGWGAWGREPYDDLMRCTDAALERPDLDAERTAVMGGSFGGYMANWIAGHTDRFRCVVTHASLWNLDQFGPTTDAAYYWGREMTAEMARDNDPSAHVDAITSPVLVIHGDEDYRVPVGEALRLWFELNQRVDDPAASPHRFLYFPDENHWILTPQHAAIWYRAVLSFLGVHVLGEPEQLDELLR